jgi:altronate dehydratase small subunit
MKVDAILINEKDNVAVAMRDIQPGETIAFALGSHHREMVVQDFIPFGHKFAVRDLKKGEDVLKYGEVIGRTTRAIPAGSHAHIQNIESLRGRGDLKAENG